MFKQVTISAQLIYTGMSDYWGGDGDRWDKNKGCLFASYGPETTLNDLVQSWLEDWNMGGDFENLPEEIEIRDADMEEAIRAIFVPDIDMDGVFEAATELEDFDEENDESPQCILLVTIDQED